MELLRPGKSEAPRYPIDTVIGSLGQGTATDAAFSFANWVAGGLLSGRMGHPSLENINPVIRENYLSAVGSVEPRFYRLGSGRQEPDGSTSFLVRFVGRESAITAEMYVRHVTIRVPDSSAVAAAGTSAGAVAEGEKEVAAASADVPVETEPASTTATATSSWMLEDLLLDEARSREQEQRSSMHRIDYVPYERFF